MAEVENIGYKRTKRWEKSMSNELYRENDEKEVILDDWKLETALDYIREGVKWGVI
jgi:type I restriction enzyme M protein